MEFRSYADLARTLTSQLSRVPPDVDIVVSIPRSGIVPATVLALGLNLPVTDVEGLLEGRIISTGEARRQGQGRRSLSECRHALVVDDSVLSGSTLARVKERVARANLPMKVTYAAVYVTELSASQVDLHFEICPNPRIFEWNYLHHHFVGTACVDLDRVIGLQPPDITNDSPADARPFFAAAVPLVRPTHRIHHLVTSWPSRYRSEVEAWLQRHEVAYDHLSMLDRPVDSVAERKAAYLALKIRLYRADDRATVMLEGNPADSARLAHDAGKPVVCVTERRVHLPPRWALASLQQRFRRWRQRVLHRGDRPENPGRTDRTPLIGRTPAATSRTPARP